MEISKRLYLEQCSTSSNHFHFLLAKPTALEPIMKLETAVPNEYQTRINKKGYEERSK